MKFCPVCKSEYENVLRFCPIDGTPLADRVASFEDFDPEKTLIRHNRPEFASSQLVIPVEESSRKSDDKVYKRTNVLTIVLLTIFGTIVLLSIGFLAGYLFSSYKTQSTNVNASNSGVNTSLSNANANYSVNVRVANANANVNAVFSENVNLKITPTRTPSPTPTIIASPSPTVGRQDETNTTPTPAVSPTPLEMKSSPTSSSIVEVGTLNGRAVELVRPEYPQSAKQAGASGRVAVRVLIDEEGKVVMAKAISGHTLLRSAAEDAAKQSRFTPVIIEGKPTKASGIVLYNFVIQ